MTVAGAQKKIVARISRWEGVDAEPHRFGGTEFRVGRRELGHVHGDHLADIAFPMDVRNRLIAEGKAQPHHMLPNSGWITFKFSKESDVESAVELFRLSYEVAVSKKSADISSR